MDGLMGLYMDGWMDGFIDGWMDGWVYRWMDGWIDECYVMSIMLWPAHEVHFPQVEQSRSKRIGWGKHQEGKERKII